MQRVFIFLSFYMKKGISGGTRSVVFVDPGLAFRHPKSNAMRSLPVSIAPTMKLILTPTLTM
jgi:hypothetical protein